MKKTTAFIALALAALLAGCNTWTGVKQDAKEVGQSTGKGIEKAGENVIRKLAADGSFSVTPPEAGRLIIFDPTSAVEYDTLYTAIEDVPVTAGSYLMFIGNQSDPFTYQYSF